MNKKKILFQVLILSLFSSSVLGQDTLPDFSVKDVGGKRIVVEWKNQYTNVKQISIQRSYDSLNRFTSVFTVADPLLPQNGYLDTEAPTDRMFYRLFILLDKGEYIFSSSKRPVLDTTAIIAYNDAKNNAKFNTNKDETPGFIPSAYVFTFRDGYVKVNLPTNPTLKYDLKFFDDRYKLLFELKDIKTRSFKLDKANFHSAGWKYFELYENDVLKEKHQFYLKEEY